MKSDRAASEAGRGRLPGHVAWVGRGSERWADGADGRARRGSGAEGPPLCDAEDRAALELVEGALDTGIDWLTIQHPAAGRALAGRARELARRGVHVLELRAVDAGRPRLEPLEPLEGLEGRVGTDGDGGGDADDGVIPAAATGPTLRVVLVSGASGRQEIVGAVRTLGERGVSPDQVDEAAIGNALDVPDVDLLVVTGGDRRVPDLLLWQVAYSEIVFLDTLWPDVGRADLDAALEEYRRRDRRYGGLVASR